MTPSTLICARCKHKRHRCGSRRVTVRGRWRWACYGCAEGERRREAWLRSNPGAYPMEIAHFDALLAQELGL